MTDFDLHLLGEGTHYRNYERLGAHLREHEGFRGVHFAVWAPNAKRVSVTGNFNHWDGRRHPLRNVGATGIWEIFIPDLSQGEVYKFEIKSRINGYLVQKSDPYGFAAELRPQTASVVWDITRFAWDDAEWMEKREKTQALDRPMAIYECHLGSWRRKIEEDNGFLSYRELADQLVEYLGAERLHARRADADRRVPVRRQLGLSARRLLRADVSVRHARRFRLFRGYAASRTASA